MKDVVGLRAKTYSYLTDKSTKSKKLKDKSKTIKVKKKQKVKKNM